MSHQIAFARQDDETLPHVQAVRDAANHGLQRFPQVLATGQEPGELDYSLQRTLTVTETMPRSEATGKAAPRGSTSLLGAELDRPLSPARGCTCACAAQDYSRPENFPRSKPMRISPFAALRPQPELAA